MSRKMRKFFQKIFMFKKSHPHKKTLKKFRKGNFIDSENELFILRRYASTGMVHFGFNYKLKKPDAKLTRQGRWFLEQLP